MLLRRADDLKSSETTPESQYLNRRELLAGPPGCWAPDALRVSRGRHGRARIRKLSVETRSMAAAAPLRVLRAHGAAGARHVPAGAPEP
jgi:hypothetical protein